MFSTVLDRLRKQNLFESKFSSNGMLFLASITLSMVGLFCLNPLITHNLESAFPIYLCVFTVAPFVSKQLINFAVNNISRNSFIEAGNALGQSLIEIYENYDREKTPEHKKVTAPSMPSPSKESSIAETYEKGHWQGKVRPFQEERKVEKN